MTDQEIVSTANGRVEVTALDGGGYSYRWIGGPLIAAALDFLADPSLARIEGETVFLGSYRAHIIERGETVLLLEQVL